MKTFAKSISSYAGALTIMLGLFTQPLLANPVSNGETIEHGNNPTPKNKVERIRANFNGSDVALYSYISKNLVYPDKLLEERFEATVYVDFTVNRLGEVTEVEVHHQECHIPVNHDEAYKECANPICAKSCDGFQSAAIDVIKGMEGWTPATVNGKRINQKFRIPIRFEIK